MQTVKLHSFAHSLQLINGKLVVTSFDGAFIDIYGINQKKIATSLNKVQSLNTCSPIYCVHVMEKAGLLIAG